MSNKAPQNTNTKEDRALRGPSSNAEIIRRNIFTAFNGLNIVLAIAIFIFGSPKNALFMGVVFSNAAIGIFQELRAKRLLDKLSLITAPKSIITRDDEEIEVAPSEVMCGDTMVLRTGHQICADGVLTEGSISVDESMLTGESDPVVKSKGDKLFSGSHVIAGSARAEAISSQTDSYAAKLTKKAKAVKHPKSEIMISVNKIIKTVGFMIVPVGIALFSKQYLISHVEIGTAVTTTVAALVGMIPEGLVLLTSVVLAVGIVRLSKKNALVQELYSIEMLARVDTLCLDKTGTITTGNMKVIAFRSLEDGKVAGTKADNDCSFSNEARFAIENIVYGLDDRNATSIALSKIFSKPEKLPAFTQTISFSSERKWSGVRVRTLSQDDGDATGCEVTYVMGATQFVYAGAPDKCEEYLDAVKEDVENGYRVIALAKSDEPFTRPHGGKYALPENLTPLGFIILDDELRENATETLSYFKGQGVDIKIISGDDPMTVSRIAEKVGVPGAEKYIDLSRYTDADDLSELALNYTIFGRVTPAQKQNLVKALKSAGRTVAMTGDGVNDVMALKEADCSIAPASGMDAARNVSQIVLLDSNFASMPAIVAEGRRSINNLQRSSSLFLTKTFFATLVALIFIFLNANYPLEPIQLTLISTLTIGFPSFVLGLQQNRELVKGHFLINVMKKAVPGALTDVIMVILITLLTKSYGASATSTITTLIVGYVGFLVLFKTCVPFDGLRTALFIVVVTAFTLAVIFFPALFSLVVIDWTIIKAIIPFGIIATVLFLALLAGFKLIDK